MNKKMNRYFHGILAAGLIVSAATIKAEEYDQHEVKENQKDVRDDLAKIRISSQQEELSKKEFALNRKKYERTMKTYGPNNSLTREAKERYENAEMAYAETRREHFDAKEGLTQNQVKLQHAQRELSEDKAKETQRTEK